MDKFCAGYNAADELERRASVVGQAEAYRERPAVIIRRIASTEAELRTLPRRWAEHIESCSWRGAEPDEAYREQLDARRMYLEQHLAEDREALAAAEAAGYKRLGPADVHRGDKVRTRFGWRTVERVS
jgi:Mg-chelatase subunit ChlI